MMCSINSYFDSIYYFKSNQNSDVPHHTTKHEIWQDKSDKIVLQKNPKKELY